MRDKRWNRIPSFLDPSSPHPSSFNPSAPMYKLLLCWRYLRTRYIAFASIISVMLGVATMIVVNSVMAGFSNEMQGRIRGIICDVVFESRTLEGIRDPDWHMEQIKRIAGDDIDGMTPICVVPAMLSYQCARQLGHQPGAGDRHRREDAEQSQRLRQVPAAPGQSPGHELRSSRRRLRHPRPPGRGRRSPERDGNETGRLGTSPPHGRANEARAVETPEERRGSPLPATGTTVPPPSPFDPPHPATAARPILLRATPRRQAVKTFDPAKEQNTGHRDGHCHGQLSQGGRRRSTSASCRATTCSSPFPRPARRPRP